MIDIIIDLYDLEQAFNSIYEDIKLEAGTYSYDVAKDILRVAKSLCPVDTGRLVNSGKLVKVGSGEYVIVFDCPYAWYVHENLSANHPNGGTAKFLDKAIISVLGSIQ